MKQLISWLKSPVLREERTLLWVWLASGIIYSIVKQWMGMYNNYKIFEHVLPHAMEGLSLYVEYPLQYGDINHYGPVFSLIIAPFAFLPTWLGMTLWVSTNTLLLFYAIKQLPLTHLQRIFIYWYTLFELMTAQGVQQFNISVVAFILLTFTFILQKRDFWAAFLILLGTLIKIYPIVGLAFFFFSKQKLRFTAYCFFWGVVLFVIPMLYTPGAEYIVGQYIEWVERLSVKNGINIFANSQNISLLGVVRKVSGCTTYSDLWLIIPGIILFFIPYLRVAQYKYLRFQLMLLANVLLFVVMFSSGSEASGYIVCMTGVAIWYICSPSPHRKYNRWLMWATLIIVSISSTDLVPPVPRLTFIVPYALKAWPCILVWFTIVYEMVCLDFSGRLPTNEKSTFFALRTK